MMLNAEVNSRIENFVISFKTSVFTLHFSIQHSALSIYFGVAAGAGTI
jgi:hypothetical protein